jgi:hypothetical protein
VTTTTAAYLQVENNLSRYQTMTADEPAVKTASAYYAANIGKVASISDFVGNYRLLSFALDAYGLGDQINSKALITQVLQGGVSNPNSLANTLNDSRWRAFAQAFNFAGAGAASISTSSAIQTTTNNYVEQQMESDQGGQDPGVQLALYFQRVAPTVTNAYGILADKNLLEVVQTIFGISPHASASNIDQQAAQISKVLPISELQDPKKVQQLVERFTAMYDLDYGPTSGATPLTVAGGNSPPSAAGLAASSILSGVITTNGQSISQALNGNSPTPLFSNSFLQTLQSFKLGG